MRTHSLLKQTWLKSLISVFTEIIKCFFFNASCSDYDFFVVHPHPLIHTTDPTS